MRILVIEDEPKILKYLSRGLKEEGYSVEAHSNGREGYERALESDFDLVILDVMIPDMNGLEICRKLRRQNKQFPILMLTARDAIEHKVEGLDAGADDYLVKPFSFSELLARIRALDRRQRKDATRTIELDHLKMDLVAHKVFYRERELDLTSQEFKLLQLFMRRPGHILSRTVIAETVWGHDFDSGTNVINVYVNYLRKKLFEVSKKDWIETRRHQGYVFDSPR